MKLIGAAIGGAICVVIYGALRLPSWPEVALAFAFFTGALYINFSMY